MKIRCIRIGEIAQWLVKTFPETKITTKSQKKAKVTKVRLQGKRVSVHIVQKSRFKS